VRGNWSDSSAYGETLLFFEFLHPEVIDTVVGLLKSRSSSDIPSIVKFLQPHLPSHVVGLLQLALDLRYFHPLAAISNPLPGERPMLRGWAATVSGTLPQFDMTDFQWKFLTAGFSGADSVARLRLFRDLVHRPFLYLQNVSLTAPSPEIRAEFETMNFAEHIHRSYINGRSVSGDAHGIIDALINEY
jgi:hypothetical protein